MSNNKTELSNENFDLDFLKSEPKPVVKHRSNYKVIIADDDEEVHSVTKMILKTFSFEGKGLIFIDTYTGKETMEALRKHPDTAILFLDVVMEENRSGLMVVDYLRKTIKNDITRIILRTGEPGEAPEDKVIRDYDINDYRLKTDLTVQRLNTSLYAALRSYRDITRLERNRRGLEKMIEASADMFKHHTMSEFLTSILNQISSFYQDELEMLYVREGERIPHSGFIAVDNQNDYVILAAKGKYECFIGKNMSEITELKEIYQWMNQDQDSDKHVFMLEKGFIVKQSGKNMAKNYIFVEGGNNEFKLDLINLFLTNYSIALDNFYLDTLASETQVEIIYTLGEVIEAQFEETSGHLKRETTLMYNFSKSIGLSNTEAEYARIASALHDVGKIGIPNAILKKPGKLTDEEMIVMHQHTEIGYNILKKSKLEILKVASDIALHHHEKYDGSGYPEGLVGDKTSIYARMLAIVDVFDAMSHKRVYKDASSIEDTLAFITQSSGSHFDPKLVDVFVSNFSDITRNAM